MTTEEAKSLLAELNEHLFKIKEIMGKLNSGYYVIDRNFPAVWKTEVCEDAHDIKIDILGNNLDNLIEFTKCERIPSKEFPYVKKALINGIEYREYVKKVD